MYLTKGHCAIHELRCSNNPENKRDCFSCSGLVSNYVGYTQHDKDGNKIKYESVKVFYCSLIDIYITPPKAQHKGNQYVLDKDNVFMPKQCNAKEEISDAFFNDPF
jgi:hypothetical protein